MTDKKTGLDLMRVKFEDHQISKLPKPIRRDSQKGKCVECGGYHGLPAVHLDYVGHAAVTDRLLDADLAWSWEPMSLSPDGIPVLDNLGGMWIKLTVCGVTRIGYGIAEGKSGGDAIKEVIGDAIRNASMRFGAALELWHKGELHKVEEDDSKPSEDSEDDKILQLGKDAAMSGMLALTEWWKCLTSKQKSAFNKQFGEFRQVAMRAENGK